MANSPNTNNISVSTTPYLVGDVQTTITGTSLSVPNSNPVSTAVNGVPVAACYEIQSTTGLLLVPRLSNANVAAITTANPTGIVDGMLYYNTTTTEFVFRENGGDVVIPTGGGAGDVVGQDPVVAFTFPIYATTNGLQINDSTAANLGAGFAENVFATNVISLAGAFNVADPTANTIITFSGTDRKAQATAGIITGTVLSALTIQTLDGAAATPSYSFASDTNMGLYRAAADTLGVSANGVNALQVTATGTNVNLFKISASDATSPVVLETIGTDTDISLRLNLKGTGALLNNVGSAASPSYGFFGRTGAASAVGIASTLPGQLDLVVNSAIQAQIQGASTSVNYVVLAGSTVDPVISSFGASPAIGLSFGAQGAAASTFRFLSDTLGTPRTQFLITNTPNSVNYIQAEGAATGTSPTFDVTGSDANVGLNFLTKGAGRYLFATNSDPVNRIQLEVLDTGTNTTSHLEISGGTTTPGLPMIAAEGTEANITVVVKTKGANTGLLIRGDGTAGNVGRLGLSNSASTFETVLAASDTVASTNIIVLPEIDGAVGQVLKVASVASPVTTLEYADDETTFLSSTVTLQTADVTSLVATPFELIPAPGAGFFIIPIITTLTYRTSAGDSFAATTSSFTFTINGVDVQVAAFAASGFITQTTSQFAAESLSTTGLPFALATLDNQPLLLGNDNVGGEFTGGTANTTLTVSTRYVVVATTGP